MPRYDPAEQWAEADPKVIAGFLKACDDLRVSERVRLALFAAGIVEANLRNPSGGDRDSVGSLQQRAGWGPVKARMDPHLAALAFLRDAVSRVLPKHPDVLAGPLAQLVQRSAFPDRYAEAVPAAAYIIDRATKGASVAAWHLAPSLKELLAEVDARWPNRDRSFDGTIGDAAHAARSSEHNPDHDSDPMPTGAVSAADITKDSTAQMDILRAALVADNRVWYVIHDGWIYSRTYGFRKRKYTGPNPHTHHMHVSLRQTLEAHDDTSSWGIAGAKPDVPGTPTAKASAPKFPGAGAFRIGRSNPAVKTLGKWLVAAGFARNHDGNGYQPGPEFTRYDMANVVDFQRSEPTLAGDPDGIPGPVTWALLWKKAQK